MKDIFLLDLDDTLLDFPRAERENLTRTLNAFGLACDGEMYARFHRINDDLWKLLERGEITREALKVGRFETLFAEFGLRADTQAVSRAYYANFPSICYPFDGAAAFLRALAARGRAYLATNGGVETQRRHIADAGFLPYFSGAFISEEVGADKPSQTFADHIAAHIPGFERKRAVWIGDSLTSDMVCAERLGVAFILFTPRGVPEGYTGRSAGDYDTLIRML